MHGYCTACGEECDSINVDFGIGPYEYWGSVGIDVQIAEFSACCECNININPPLIPLWDKTTPGEEYSFSIYVDDMDYIKEHGMFAYEKE